MDLISREKLLEKEKYLADWNIDLHYIDSEDVKSLPPADVRENIHARWKRKIVDDGFNADWVCSNCGHRVYTDFVNYKFCPMCGSQMDKPE